MCPMQPWRRLGKVEGMEERDGWEMGMPDLPKGTQRRTGWGGRQQTGGLSVTLQPPGCGEKEGETPRVSLFRLPPKEQ